tara:strand:+ start:405 stop:794 length:390 start_codon:yes stop_codon:yes gene_type:complete
MATGINPKNCSEVLQKSFLHNKANFNVVVSNSIFDFRVKKKTQALFENYNKIRVPSALLYLNVRKKTYAIISNNCWNQGTPDQFWKKISIALEEELISTHPENALIPIIQAIGMAADELFPIITPENIS